MMAVVNRLNEVELASQPLKDAAEKLHKALAAPLPDLGKIKRARDRTPVVIEWAGSLLIAARPFLKANGGKFHDELRELWEVAIASCKQEDIDAVRKWLQEQFQIGVAIENESVESVQSTKIAEQPTGDNTPNGPESDSPPDSVGDLQADQVEDN